MAIRNRIIALLQRHPEGLDDDVIAEKLQLSRRQQANSRCRALEEAGLVERHPVNGKIRSFWIGSNLRNRVSSEDSFKTIEPNPGKPWCWEGNVVCAVARHLAGTGWTIERTANTASGQSGADIRARRNDEVLIIEVKGYPSKVYERGDKIGQGKKTNPSTQARHWMAEALFTAMLRQAEGQAHQVAIAFPDFQVYSKLLRRIRQSILALGLTVLLVHESGSVVIPYGEGI